MITVGEVQLGLLGALVLVAGIGAGALATLLVRWRREHSVLAGMSTAFAPAIASVELTAHGRALRRREAERARAAIADIRSSGRCPHCPGHLLGCDCGGAIWCPRCTFGVSGPHASACDTRHKPLTQSGFPIAGNAQFGPPLASLGAAVVVLLLACPAPSLAADGPGAVAPLAHALFAFLILAALNFGAALALRRFWPARRPGGITFRVSIDATAALAALDRAESQLERIWRAHANKVGREAIDYLRARRAPAGFREHMSGAGLPIGIALLVALLATAASAQLPMLWGRGAADGNTASNAPICGRQITVVETAGGPEVYIAAGAQARVRKLDVGSVIQTLLGTTYPHPTTAQPPGPLPASYPIKAPAAVAVDGRDLYAASDSVVMARMWPDSDRRIVIDLGQGHQINSIYADGEDHLYVSEPILQRVLEYTLPCGLTCGAPRVVATGLNDPRGMTKRNGVLYVSESLANRIRAIAPNGTITTVAGGGLPVNVCIGGPTPGAPCPGGVTQCGGGGATCPVNVGDGLPALQAKLVRPDGIDFDAQGRLMIADVGQNRVRRVEHDGTMSTRFGTGAKQTTTNWVTDKPPLEQPLSEVSGVACAANGWCYAISEIDCTLAVWNEAGAPATPTRTAAATNTVPPTLTATRTLPPATATATRTSTAASTPTIAPTATASATTIPTCQAGQVPECTL